MLRFNIYAKVIFLLSLSSKSALILLKINIKFVEN